MLLLFASLGCSLVPDYGQAPGFLKVGKALEELNELSEEEFSELERALTVALEDPTVALEDPTDALEDPVASHELMRGARKVNDPSDYALIRFYIWGPRNRYKIAGGFPENYRSPVAERKYIYENNLKNNRKYKRDTWGAEIVDPSCNSDNWKAAAQRTRGKFCTYVPYDSPGASEYFDPSLKTIVMIHGFGSSVDGFGLTKNGGLVRKLQSMPKYADKYNFIGVDWRGLANFGFIGSGYDDAAANVKHAAERVAWMVLDLLGWPHDKDDNSDDKIDEVADRILRFHFIGHSLGAHIAGKASRNIYSALKKAGHPRKVPHITALDQANPKFAKEKSKHNKERLLKTDATYVDAVDTNGKLYGYHYGDTRPDNHHATFYFNGGSEQKKQCSGWSDIFGCSHSMSSLYYIEMAGEETESGGFKGYSCQVEPNDDPEKGWAKPKSKGCLQMDLDETASWKNFWLKHEYSDGDPDVPYGTFLVMTRKKAKKSYTYPEERWSDNEWNTGNRFKSFMPGGKYHVGEPKRWWG